VSCYRDRAPTLDEVRKHARAYPFGDDGDEGLWIGIRGMPFIVRTVPDVAHGKVMVSLDDGEHADWWDIAEIHSDEWCPCDEKGRAVAWPVCP